MQKVTPNLPNREPTASITCEQLDSAADHPILQTQNLSIQYGNVSAIRNVSFSIPERHVTALVGPSGCGKSSLLRQFNRMNDFITGHETSGNVFFRGENLYRPGADAVEIRRRIGMVFQKPNPFPESVFQNLAWGLKLHGQFQDDELAAMVESSLRQANLWNEVTDRLNDTALGLSGGQQQRLCIARALAMQPDVILMDEPCSALDPVSTAAVEELILDLKKRITIVLVTHNLQQAKRVADVTAFLDKGELIEFGATYQVLGEPRHKRTKEFIASCREQSSDS